MLTGRTVIQVTPGYCPAEMFDASRSVIPWTDGVVDEKWVLLNKYPLPSVEENEAALVDVASRHAYMTFDSDGDLGLHGSLNNFLSHNPQPPGTVLISVDPDSACTTPGWDKALVECVTAGFPIAACAIPEVLNQAYRWVAGHRVFVHPSIQMFNVCAFDLDFIARCGGFAQPVKYWGGLEQMLYAGLLRENAHLVYALDYPNIDYSIRETYDPRYAAYKWEHYYGRFPGSFAEYLASPVVSVVQRPYPID